VQFSHFAAGLAKNLKQILQGFLLHANKNDNNHQQNFIMSLKEFTPTQL
jgi:hypothetical protein